ncbi:SNF5-domain-containing protein [Meredithblackwellia eburnea MCA 4105]
MSHFPQQNGAHFAQQSASPFTNGYAYPPTAQGAIPPRRPSSLEEVQLFQQHQQQQMAHIQAQAQAAAAASASVSSSSSPATAVLRPPPGGMTPNAAAMHQAALLRGVGVGVPPGGAGAVPPHPQMLAAAAARGVGGPGPGPAAALHHPQGGQMPQSSPILAAPIDGGPAFKVPLIQMFTRTSMLEPGAEFPKIDKDDAVRVKKWMARDIEYEKELIGSKRSRKSEFQEIAEDVIRSQDWLGGVDVNSRGARFKPRWEQDRLKERDKGKRGNHRKEVKLTKQALRAIAKVPEVLVPIRLEYEHEAYKLRDTFTWNLRESIVTPEVFASHLCEDLRLPFNPFYKEIVSQIKRHIEDASLAEEYEAYLGDRLDGVREENRQWFEELKYKRKLDEEGFPILIPEEMDETEQPLTLRDFQRQEGRDEELRVLIKLDITLDSFQLVDKFEWDISDPHNSPEAFAEIFAADLGLGGEFKTAIAHSIREQVDVFVKSLCLLGHVTGLPIPDDDLRREFLPSLFEPFRPDAAEFTPVLTQLSPDEVERNDKEREREVRRKRRQTKGRGVTLPDRDHVKTHRTLVPKPSTVPIQSYQDSRGDMVYPMPEMSRPYPIEQPVLPPKPQSDGNLAEAPPPPTVGFSEKGHVVVEAGPSNGRLKRLKFGDGSIYGSLSHTASGTPYDGGTRATTPTPSDRNGVMAGKASPSNKFKKAPIIQPSLEELGLHEHIIDGQWFCANCGIPDALAIGRRKGPSGNNSLCGTCGKFFHRYRRQRPCDYTRDPDAHKKVKKVPERKKAALAAAAAAASAAVVPSGDAGEPQRKEEEEIQSRSTSRRASVSKVSRPASDDESMDSGDDSDSSSVPSEAPRPVTRQSRGNSPDLPYVDVASSDSNASSPQGDSHFDLSARPPVPTPAPRPVPPAPVVVAPPVPAPSRAAVAPAPVKPSWMEPAADALRAKNPDDRFEIIPRGRAADPSQQDWRIRCLDCPGKIYNIGPGETLDNFSVHFKNKAHRGNVQTRQKAAAGSA